MEAPVVGGPCQDIQPARLLLLPQDRARGDDGDLWPGMFLESPLLTWLSQYGAKRGQPEMQRTKIRREFLQTRV